MPINIDHWIIITIMCSRFDFVAVALFLLQNINWFIDSISFAYVSPLWCASVRTDGDVDVVLMHFLLSYSSSSRACHPFETVKFLHSFTSPPGTQMKMFSEWNGKIIYRKCGWFDQTHKRVRKNIVENLYKLVQSIDDRKGRTRTHTNTINNDPINFAKCKTTIKH